MTAPMTLMTLGSDSPDNAMAASCTKEYKFALFDTHLKMVIQDINGILSEAEHPDTMDSALTDLRSRCSILVGKWDNLLNVKSGK